MSISKHTMKSSSTNATIVIRLSKRRLIGCCIWHCTVHRSPTSAADDKTFTRNSDLVLHLVVNHRERPYNCNQCDKKYFKNSHLTRHQRYRAAEVPQFSFSQSIMNQESVKAIKSATCAKSPFQVEGYSLLTSDGFTVNGGQCGKICERYSF